VTSLIALLRRAARALNSESRRDDGVIGLVIAIALIAASVAVIASLARQNKEAEVRRLSGNATSVKLLKNSVISYFLTDADGAGAGTAINGRLPCPDTDFPPDGNANGTTTCTASTGVVPYLTMGLSQDDVIDSYGNYFTYAVTGNATALSVCESVTNAYNNTLVEYTGTLNEVTDTEVRLSSQSAGQGAPYYYAIISHGENGLGAIARNGSRRTGPTSTSEIQNCPSSNSTNCTDPSAVTLISGPADITTSAFFDDTVYVGSNTQLTELCESLTPGGQVNADIAEDFTGTNVGSLPPLIASVAGTASTQQSTVTGNTTDRVLRFTGANAVVRTASTAQNPAERARYVSFEWRPTTLGSNSTAGVSVGLRATAADRNNNTNVNAFTADLFNAGGNDGLTVRFFDDTNNNADGSTDNRIYICDNTTSQCDNDGGDNLASSNTDTFRISNNTAYTVEVYDDGVQIWARITRVGSTAANDTAFVSLTSLAFAQSDFADTNGIFAVNYSDATVEIDDVLVGRGGMGVAFDGANDIVSTGGDNHDTTTGNLTLEAWIRPDTLPTGTNRAVLISKWTQGGATSAQSYRLSLLAGGTLSLELAGDPGTGATTETHTFGGYSARAGRWDHITVTYNGTGGTDRSAKLYVDRELIARSASTAFGTNGVQNATAAFTIGNDVAATSATAFDGDMTDVRVWDVARTAQQVFANYNRRIRLTDESSTSLIVNWTLDRDTTATTLPTFSATEARPTATTTTDATGVVGTLTNGAAYVAINQKHVPVFATSTICTAGGAQGAVVGAFQCEYRLAAQTGTFATPNNLASIHVKSWGGGGGGYDFTTFEAAGGGGGYSAARLYALNAGAIPVVGQTFNVDPGGGGTASADDNNGAGGGGASALWIDLTTDRAGVASGGGGGASYGDDNLGGGFNCNMAGDCGPGGNGGGPNNIAGLTAVTTSRAADDGQTRCGGRGGDNTPSGTNPPHTTDCENGGTDPTTTSGGGGTGASGGASLAGAGGAGFNGTGQEIGAGGAGGGVRVSAMTSGGGEAGGYDANAGIATASTTDTNGSGFGGGGGSGFIDDSTINFGYRGAAGGTPPAAGGTTDPNYSGSIERVVGGTFTTTAYCVANPTGNQCTTTPGRGGEPNGITSGRPGAVIIKW